MLAGHGVTAVGKAAPGQQRPRDHRELVSHAHRAVKGMCSVMVDIGEPGEAGGRFIRVWLINIAIIRF